MKALVTGGTGFIGSHIVDHLLTRGDRVRALVRPSSNIHRLAQRDVYLVRGDLSDPATLDAAVEGVDSVYHCAGLVGKEHTAAAIMATNVVGTENLLEACVRQAVGRFVLISTVSVYAPCLMPLIDEEAPQGGTGVYGRSKSAAEQSVRRYARECGMSYSILRPCRVYGERDSRYTAHLLRALGSPVLVVGAGGWPYYNLVHVADVATMAILAGTRPEAAGQAFNVTDGRGALRQEIAETLREITGRKQLILPVPKRLVEYAYERHATLKAYRTWNTRTKPSTQWKQLFSGQCYDISKARRQLGYEPQIAFQEGLRRAWTWYAQQITT